MTANPVGLNPPPTRTTHPQERSPGHDRHHQLDLNHPTPPAPPTRRKGAPAMTATTSWT